VGTTMIVRIPRGRAHLPQERIGPARSLASTRTDAQPYLDEALGWMSEDEPSPPADERPAVAAQEGSEKPRAPPADPGASSRETILVVDDNVEMRRLLSQLLRSRWRVTTARDGVHALERIRQDPPSLVISDIMMPRMDGIEMLRTLRADPATAELPVLLLSARAGEEASVGGLQAGADDYLVKPFSRRELIARADALLARAAQRAAERRAREQAEQNVRIRDEFFAALAHELRSPISSLLAWIEVLRNGKLERQQLLEGLEALELAARTVSRLSDDLRDLARTESGHMHMEFRTLASIAPLVTAAADAFAPSARQKGVALSIDLEPRCGPIKADADRLQQVLWNLLSNAIRFTPPGGRIALECGRRGEVVELRVRDSGRGIEAEDLPHIFEQYWQHKRTSDRESGLGLGLSISRRIVELHGGSIEAESEGEGRGATLIARFPLLESRAPPPSRKRRL
ncbi:MAG TPA: ATP-binding protein, partial [Steroidobacteraceae bacterium]|nr:ATP-binding protein [Steroidobacteraceae bacterium]